MPSLRQKLISSLAKRYPFYSGVGTIANHPLLNFLAGKSTERLWVRVPGGELLAPLEDHVGRAAYYLGDLDRKLTWICSKIVDPGDLALDVGANLGLITLWLSHLVGPKGRVHSFEPNPELQGLLSQSIKKNNRSNVHLHEIALGNRNQQLLLRVPGRNRGMGTLRYERELGIDRISQFEVPVRPLSEVCKEESLNRIRFLKIDVEGFELEVLKGAEPHLSKHQVEAILFEVNDSVRPFWQREITQYLSELDYAFFGIPKSLLRMHVRKIEPGMSGEISAHDILAVPRGRCYEEIAARINAK